MKSTTNDGALSAYRSGKKNRQARAAQRLKAQLKAGTKPEFIQEERGKKKVWKQTNNTVPLSEHDVKRIEKELEKLTK